VGSGVVKLELYILETEDDAIELEDNESIELTDDDSCEVCEAATGFGIDADDFVPCAVLVDDTGYWFVCLDCVEPVIHPAEEST
jgi:hypothetical protein